MSAQSGKKKRLGSRRRGGNQSETSEPHEFHVKDSTSVAQPTITEENTESSNVLSNPDYSQSETKHPPSPEFTGNRRKLASSRRSKGRQHVKDSVTEPYNKPREETEENMSNETLGTTQMSLAIQPERQTESNQGNEHDTLYVTHDSSLYSVTTPGYSSEVQNPSCSEVDMESLIPENENMQPEHDKRETDCELVSDSCKLVEIMLGEMDKSDTLENAEVSGQVEENTHPVGVPEFNSSSLRLSPTVDQQLNDQSKSREMPGEELPSVYSVTENKKSDDNTTDLLRQDGNLQGNYLVSESYVKSEDIEFSTTPVETTDKNSLGENTEIEFSVEQATFRTTEELSSNEEQNEHFNLSEVKDAQHSDDEVNEVHAQEVKHTQTQEMLETYSSGSVIHDATEKSDTCSENLIEPAEVRDTYQSELSVKSSDDSATKQELSNPDDKQDEHPIKESNMEALNQRNKDVHVSNTKEPWISNIAPHQVYEGEGQVEDNVKPSAEQTVHQEREELLYKVEERESYLQNLQSEINAPLDSQPQDDSVSVEEQTDTDVNPIGNRRKMGSSRRNKGRQHIKESVATSYHEPTEGVLENMRGSESFETMKISLATEPIRQEELSQESEPDMTPDNSLYSAATPVFSSGVQNLTTTNHPEIVLVGLQADNDERETDCTVVSDVCESVETTLEEKDKSDTPQPEDISDQVKETSHLVGISEFTGSSLNSSSTVDQQISTTLQITTEKNSLGKNTEIEYIVEQATFPSPTEESTNEEQNEHFNLSEVKCAQISDDSVNEGQSDTCSENLIDQVEIRDTFQSELSVKSTDDSATKQELSNPDDKQDEHPIKESNVEALDQRNEDVHVSNTEEPWITNIAQCQVYEGEGQVEEDIKPIAEVHQVKEGFLSEGEECKSSLQTQQSEINNPLDSQPQDDSVSIEEQTDTSFKPIANRRKMGSSRRNKGRQHIKDPVAESYHEATEEVVGNSRDNEALEAMKRSLIIETTVEEKSVETMLEEMDTLDTSQTEEVSDQVKENAHDSTLVGISEFTGSSLHSSPTVDQQIIDQSNSREMPNEELPDVYSVTDTENKERDEDTELLWQHGNLQDNYLVSESYVKSEDEEFSTSPEITAEKSSLGEMTEIVYSVENATFLSSNGELSTNEEQNEHFNLAEVRDAQHSEEVVYKGHEQEVKETQIQEMRQIDYSSESVIHDATGKSDTGYENLIDQVEIRDTYQSELSVKSTDDSATKQELSNPDDKQDEHPTKESNMESLDQRNEEVHVSNTEEPWITNIAQCQVYEGEGQVEEDIKPIAEVHQVKEGFLSEVEECKSSLQTQQSEINTPLDSQPQHDSVSIEGQTDTSFKPIANRRKMGSSRRNKGRQHIKDPVAESCHEPTEEVVGNSRDNEALEAMKRSLIIETTVEEKSVETMLEEMDKLDTSQTEEVSGQVKENAQEMPNEAFPDVYSVTDTENKERDEDTELLWQHGNLQDNYLVSESHVKSEDVEFSTSPEITTEKSSLGEMTEIVYSVEKATFLSPNGELYTNEEQNEHFNLSEVKCAQISDDAVNEVPEQENKATQMKEMHEMDYSSESVIHDAIGKSDTGYENLIDQVEIRDTYQSELSVKSTDDSATKQELSNPDDKQDEHPIKESNMEALDQKNEDVHVSNTEEPWISNIAPCQVYEGEGQVEEDIKPIAEVHQVKEGFLSEVEECKSSLQTQQSEINTPLDSQPQDDSVSIEEQTDTSFKPIANRRKMGSSRRNKGRQHIKDPVAESYYEPTEEVVGNSRDNEALEAMKRSLIIETTVEEKSVETMLEEMDTLDTSQTEEVSDQVKENTQEMPNEAFPNVYSVTDTENKERDEDTELVDQHENLQDNYLVSESHVKSEDVKFSTSPEITTEKSSLGDMTEIVYSVEKASKSPNGELSTNEEQNEHFNLATVRDAQHSEEAAYKGHEQEVKATQMHEMDQIDYSSDKDGKSSLHTLQSGIQSPLDSQPQDESVSIKTQTHTGFNPTVNRRKMGSSRRHKERQPFKDSVAVSDMDPKSRSSSLDVFKQEEAFQVQNMEAISSDKESLTNNMMETEENVMVKDMTETRDSYNTEEEGSINVHVSGQDEVGEKCEDHTAQEINTSHEVSHAELLSADTLASLDIGHEGSFRAEPAVDVSEDDAHKSRQGTQENSDYSENLQIKSKQKRRKMGSTRRTVNRKQQGGMDNKDETEESDLKAESDKVQEVAEVSMVVTTNVSQNEHAKLSLSTVYEEQEINEAGTVQDEERTVRSSTSDLHSTDSNTISGIDDLMALLPEQSASFSEEVVNAIKCFQVRDIGDSERNVVVSVETSPADDVTSTAPFSGTTQSDEKGPKDIKVIQGQDTNEQEALKQTTEVPGVTVADLEIVKSAIRGAGERHENVQADIQEPKDMNEGDHNTNFEMKYASAKLGEKNRRKKLGSSRRNIRTISKGEEVHQKQEVDNEATETNVGDVMTERVSGIKEQQLQLQKEHKDGDSEPGKEKVFETVEYSHTGDSYTKPPGHQTVEENPVSGQLVETEQHLTPNDIPVEPATSPKHDAMSESAYGGRRRKMGSHRKSHGHQTAREDRIIDTETGRHIKTFTDESDESIKTLEGHREESLGLDKKSEVIESDKTPSSNISISKTGEHSRPVSEKTLVQHRYAEVRLDQESLSLAGNSKGANSYNVIMVGDSSVGKTSFMKRAQSGKFSFDLPASVGLDSCLWTVVVDGKPVVLQLWDTAGQERFHSITRQVFHKAQAFLLMYDITCTQSFSAVRYWASCIQEGAAEDVTILLLGNKSDSANRQVATQEGEILAKEYNFDFMECSAATGENVVRSLEIAARLLSQKFDIRKEVLVLHKEPQQKKTSGCC